MALKRYNIRDAAWNDTETNNQNCMRSTISACTMHTRCMLESNKIDDATDLPTRNPNDRHATQTKITGCSMNKTQINNHPASQSSIFEERGMPLWGASPQPHHMKLVETHEQYKYRRLRETKQNQMTSSDVQVKRSFCQIPCFLRGNSPRLTRQHQTQTCI